MQGWWSLDCSESHPLKQVVLVTSLLLMRTSVYVVLSMIPETARDTAPDLQR